MKKLFVIFFLCLFLLPLVNAIPPVIQAAEGTEQIQVELTAPTTVPTSTTVNVSVHTFNQTTGLLIPTAQVSCEGMIVDQHGIRITTQAAKVYDDHFYFTLNNTMATTPGIYVYTLHCNTSTIGGFRSGFFFVTPSGLTVDVDSRTETIKLSIYALLIMGTILFLGFIFYKSEKRNEKGKLISESSIPIRWSFLLGSLIFYIMASNIISRMMGDEIINTQLSNFFNFLSAVSFYALWFIGGLLFIIWFLTFLSMWLVRKNSLAFKKLEGIYD